MTTTHHGDLRSGCLPSDAVLRHIPDLAHLTPPADHWQWWAVPAASGGGTAVVGILVSPGRLRALYIYGTHAAGAVEVDITQLPSRTVHQVHGTLSRVLADVSGGPQGPTTSAGTVHLASQPHSPARR
ncbi:hypothetical protein [Gandjariella thermophila]|uniref:Uncharacterized protein n=1 Tax=Gandjariella thermophila TaxID=1931992 RepID=A0A4D4JHB0_9PSEU|nr:hypothetical protein [Gandjariella thermophila]GDY34028.1 hypothetical protein GTS_56610 [Gandjariella thermophila]